MYFHQSGKLLGGVVLCHIGDCPRMAIFRNLFVPDERDLRFASTGSDFNPQNTKCIPAVKIFAFLDLAKNFSFSDNLLGQKGGGGSNRKCEIEAEVQEKMKTI